MENKTNILHTSGKITLAFLAFVLMLGGWIGNVFSYGTQSGTRYDLRRDSRSTDYILYQPFANTYTMYFGTESVTGSGTAGYIPGTSTALPRLQYNSSALTFNFVGATLQNEGVDVTVSSDLTGYIAVSGGTGTGNVLTNTTLDGTGTLSANVTLSGNITANSLLITPTELSSVNNATGEIQSQITTATGSITNHVHTGADGTAQIAHDSVTGTGTNSHATLDNFVASKAQASGLASLDSNSLVVENPANGTTTPTANKIVIADGSGKTADGWLNSTVSLLGQTIELGTETTGNTDAVSEGSSNRYYLDSRVNEAVGSLSVNALSDVNISFNENDFIKIVGGQLVAGSSSATVAFSAVTGSASASQLPLISGLLGSATSAQLPTVIRLTGTTTPPEAGAYGQIYVQSSGGSSGGGPQNAVLLLHGDGADTSTVITNSTDSGITMSAVGDAQIDTAQSVFGGASILFDGTTDYIAGSDTASVLMNQDFELDMRVRFNSVATVQNLYYHNTDGNNLCNLQYHTGSGALRFFVDVGGSEVMAISHLWSPSTGIWYAIRVALDASENTYYLWVDGSLVKTVIDTDKPADYSNDFYFGRGSTAGESNLDGWLDEIRLKTGTGSIQTTGTYTVAGVPYSDNYTQYSAKYSDPVNGNTVFEILTTGTATTIPSYIFNNGSATIIGAGTTTGVVDGTDTVYALYVDGASLGGSWQVTSTKSKKENIKKLGTKVERLEAEAIAKKGYIASNKPLWISLNEANYTYIGSNTATYVDAEAMENDYSSYIELAWASDGSQTVYVDNVQKESEKQFWQVFDTVQPSGWNPLGQPNIDRKGFVVEDMPDVVKGDNGLSIDPMKLIAYIALVVQELKDASLLNFKAIEELLTTGTITSGKLIKDRIEVLDTAQ